MCLGSEWVGVVGTLGGVLVGGIVTHFVEKARAKRDRYDEWIETLRAKLEETAQVVEDVRQGYREKSERYRTWTAAVSRGDFESSGVTSIQPPVARMFTLIRHYVPALAPKMKNLAEASTSLHSKYQEVVQVVKREPFEHETVLAAVKEMDAALLPLNVACAELHVALSAEAQRLVPEQH